MVACAGIEPSHCKGYCHILRGTSPGRNRRSVLASNVKKSSQTASCRMKLQSSGFYPLPLPATKKTRHGRTAGMPQAVQPSRPSVKEPPQGSVTRGMKTKRPRRTMSGRSHPKRMDRSYDETVALLLLRVGVFETSTVNFLREPAKIYNVLGSKFSLRPSGCQQGLV